MIDHSVQVDDFGTRRRLSQQHRHRIRAQQERYIFLRWGQTAFRQFQGRAAGDGHRPPGESRVPRPRRVRRRSDEARSPIPDTLVGTDSHTTMINGLGVLGWGVGGIEAEAAMLGQPVSMLIPQVVGFKLSRPTARRRDRDRSRADRDADAAQERRRRQVRRVLRARRRGAGARRPRDDRQHGPGIRRDLRHLPDRRRDAAISALHRPAGGASASWSRRTPRNRACSTRRTSPEPVFSDTLELDLATVEPSLAGPTRPQDRVTLGDVKKSFAAALPTA